MDWARLIVCGIVFGSIPAIGVILLFAWLTTK